VLAACMVSLSLREVDRVNQDTAGIFAQKLALYACQNSVRADRYITPFF
jgi:hypothetical protein